jgi:hypothetical protein
MQQVTKQPTKRQQAMAYLLRLPNAQASAINGLAVITYIHNSSKSGLKYPTVAIFGMRGNKPLQHVSFQSEQERIDFIAKHVERAAVELQHAQTRLEQGQEESKLIQVGTILYSSWGYEQTNIDFYIVTERKNLFVTIQQIGSALTTMDGDMSGKCIAEPANIVGQPMRKKITRYGTINLNSFSYCGVWDGQPKYWSSYA